MIVVNGAKRGRPGSWILDGIDPEAGKRRWWTFRTRQEAEAERDRIGPQRRQAHDRPTLPINITVNALADHWLKDVAITHAAKPRTAESYEGVLRTHVRPALGHLKVREVTREDIKAMLLDLLQAKKAKATVRLALAVARACLAHGKEAHVIATNPAGDRLAQRLGLFESKRAHQEATKRLALDKEELGRLLEAARSSDEPYYRRLHPMLLFVSRTGLRLGEVVALEWADVNLAKGEAHIIRNITRGRAGTPKSGIGRRVQLSPQVVAMLEQLHTDSQLEQVERGWGDVPQVFTNTAGTVYDPSRVAKAVKEILTLAGLPRHHSMKSLRHSFASQLIAAGVSPAFVQNQLGHADIGVTLKVYGSWLPHTDAKRAVALLDDALAQTVSQR